MKKTISLLLAAAMLLCLLPAAALAEEHIIDLSDPTTWGTEGTDWRCDNYQRVYFFIDESTDAITLTGSLDSVYPGKSYGIEIDFEKDLNITLRNVDLEWLSPYCGDEDLTATLILEGTNTLSSNVPDCQALACYYGSMVIKGTGTLKTEGKAASNYGIAVYGDLTIESGTVEASSNGYNAIEALGDVVVKDGTVTAISEQACGLYAGNHVNILGGSVTAEGEGTGIYSALEMTVKNASVETTSENFGINCGGSLTVEKSSLKAYGREDQAVGIYINDWGYEPLYLCGGLTVKAGDSEANAVSVEKYQGEKYLEIAPAIEEAPIPATGDGMGLFIFAGLALISMLGMAVLKRREQN